MKTSLVPGSVRMSAASDVGCREDALDVGAAQLHVDRRRKALVQDGIDHAAGLEVRAQLRQFIRHRAPHAVHVLVTADPWSSFSAT